MMIKNKQRSTFTDTYHNVFVVPSLIFLLAITEPIIRYHGNGLQMVSAIALILGWAVLVIYDGMTGRLKQTEWVVDNSIYSLVTWLKKHGGKYKVEVEILH